MKRKKDIWHTLANAAWLAAPRIAVALLWLLVGVLIGLEVLPQDAGVRLQEVLEQALVPSVW